MSCAHGPRARSLLRASLGARADMSVEAIAFILLAVLVVVVVFGGLRR